MAGIGIRPEDLAALIVAISFAAGLNVYATVLTLGLLARQHWVVLPGALQTLADPWIVAASGILFAGEFIADKIPGVDLLWNLLHTFIRIPVAALLAYAAGAHLTPQERVIAAVAGGTIALLAHGSKTAVRAAVTPSPEPVSNIALSAGEDVTAIGLSWAATHHPVLAGSIAAGLAVAGVAAVVFSIRLVRRGIDAFRRRRSPTLAPAPRTDRTR